MYETNRQLSCITVGYFLAVAWWIFIDGVWRNQAITHASQFVGYAVMVPLGSTISFVMLNLISLQHIISKEEDEDEDNPKTSSGCRILLRFWWFFWLSALFTSGGAAIWIWVEFYKGSWTGFSLFLSALLILLDAVLFSIFRYYFRRST